MPWSHPQVRRPILKFLADKISRDGGQSSQILDLGIGSGTFGKLIKTRIPSPTRITGVEIWEKYRGRNWAYYDEIILEDIRAFLARDSRAFDFVLMIDVLEHFEKPYGEEVLRDLRCRAQRAIIVSTPITDYPQGPFRGNQNEVHRCIWRRRDLKSAGFRKIYSTWSLTFAVWPPVAKLGVFVFDKQSGD